MKVSDIINRVTDIQKCRDLLKKWTDGEITEKNRINAIADDIDTHLEAYEELLMNREVK